MSMEEPFEFKIKLSRKCNYNKSLSPGSTLERTKEYHTRVGLQMGMGLCSDCSVTSEYETVCTSQPCVQWQFHMQSLNNVIMCYSINLARTLKQQLERFGNLRLPFSSVSN